MLFIDGLATKFNTLIFFRKNLQNDISLAYSNLLFKNEAFFQFNVLILNQFKVVTFFI
jgi:hypothetical protein